MGLSIYSEDKKEVLWRHSSYSTFHHFCDEIKLHFPYNERITYPECQKVLEVLEVLENNTLLDIDHEYYYRCDEFKSGLAYCIENKQEAIIL